MDNKINKPTYDELEAQVKQLAAENAARGDVIKQILRPGEATLSREHRAAAVASIECPATDAYLSQLRNEARTEIAVMMEGHAARYDALAKQAEDFGVDNRYRFTSAMFRGVAKELREGKAGEVSNG